MTTTPSQPTLTDLSLAQKVVLRWHLQRRPNQTPPDNDDWLVWLILAGRGFGKTRTGAEDLTEFLLFPPNPPTKPLRAAVVAPTFASARDVCIEGESGLLNTVPQPLIANWNRSMGELNLHPNPPHNPYPSLIKCYSSEEPEALRGPQHHRAWCDELAAWKNMQDTWDMLMMGLRLGTNPRAVVTTTPKARPLIKDLLARPTTALSTGSTFDNAENLSPAALDELRRRYEGTRLGRQELYAELLLDVEGALWTDAMIEPYRLPLRDPSRLVPNSPARDYVRVAVAVDPAVTSRRTSNLTGIVAGALTTQSYPSLTATHPRLTLPPSRHVDVLYDRSVQASPDVAMRRAVALYHEVRADHIVAEANQGGDFVRTVIHGIDPSVPVTLVHASHGKTARAEPVVAVYEQGRVHHPMPTSTSLPPLHELEDQLTSWEPLEDPTSPDRLDALVWLVTDLLDLDRKNVGGFHATTYRDTRLRGRR